MKSAVILAASAAAVLGGAHATAPERKRLAAAKHESVQRRTKEAFGRKAAPKGRGLQDGAMSTPPTNSNTEVIPDLLDEPEVVIDSPELGLGPELVPDVAAAMSMPTAAPVTDAPTTTTPTYYPIVDTDYPTYSPTAPEPPVAAASTHGAGVVTLLVAGVAGVWATLN